MTRTTSRIISKSALRPSSSWTTRRRKILLKSDTTIAAPTLLYVENAKDSRGKKAGIYYLATEIYPHRYTTDPEGEWQVKVFFADSPDGTFSR